MEGASQEEVARAVRAAVLELHDLKVEDVAFIPPGMLPKHLERQAPAPRVPRRLLARTWVIDLERWLIGRIAAVARVPVATVERDAPHVRARHRLGGRGHAGRRAGDAARATAIADGDLGARPRSPEPWRYLAPGGDAPVAPAVATAASLTQEQRALWFAAGAGAATATPYHIVGALRLRRASPEELERTLAALARRHPSLSASFPLGPAAIRCSGRQRCRFGCTWSQRSGWKMTPSRRVW